MMKKAPQKVYVVDNGFVEAKAFSVSENLGRLLENQVFIELVRRGYHAETSLFYYRSRNDKETDFVTRQGAHVESLIQVCYDLSSERTLKRKIDSIIECAGELKCSNLIIVTMNEERVIEKNGYKSRFCLYISFKERLIFVYMQQGATFSRRLRLLIVFLFCLIFKRVLTYIYL